MTAGRSLPHSPARAFLGSMVLIIVGVFLILAVVWDRAAGTWAGETLMVLRLTTPAWVQRKPRGWWRSVWQRVSEPGVWTRGLI